MLDTPKASPVRFLKAAPLIGPQRGVNSGGFICVAGDDRWYALEPSEAFAVRRNGQSGSIPAYWLSNKTSVHASAVWRQMTPASIQKGLLPAGERLHAALERGRSGGEGCEFLVLNASDGAKWGGEAVEWTPVFDGMIAAWQRLFVSTESGAVVCLGGKFSAAAP